eukprot:7379180-Prymnesium_polylepis.1
MHLQPQRAHALPFAPVASRAASCARLRRQHQPFRAPSYPQRTIACQAAGVHRMHLHRSHAREDVEVEIQQFHVEPSCKTVVLQRLCLRSQHPRSAHPGRAPSRLPPAMAALPRLDQEGMSVVAPPDIEPPVAPTAAPALSGCARHRS